jgi:type I restriction enzyme S subunit
VLINDDRQFCVQRHIGILRPSRSVNAIFLARVLKSKWVLDQATTFATGIAQKTVALSGLRKILIPLPPFAEQHRIVAKLDHLMGVCDRLEAAQNERETRRDQLTASAHHHLSNGEDAEELRTHAQFFIDHLSRLTKRPDQIKQLRQTILNLAVHGKLVPISPLESLSPLLVKRINQSEINPAPFTIPATWMWAKVNHIADTRLGKMLDKAKNIGNPHRYLRNINVRWFDFDLSDLYEMRFRDDELEEYSLRSGDVLICEGGEPGRAAVWDSREKNVYFQKAIHRVRFSKGVNPYFFLNTLRESVDSGRLSDYFTGVGIKHFTGRGLSSFSFPLPPLAEQQRIVAKVDELMAFCDKLEASLSTAQTETSRLLESVLHHALEASA